MCSFFNTWESVFTDIRKFLNLSVPSQKNIERNQCVFDSCLWVSFPKNQSAGSYFAMFLCAEFYCTSTFKIRGRDRSL